jgi:hypothetical protein
MQIKNSKKEKMSLWTQLDTNKSNKAPKHNHTKEVSKTPFNGLQAIGKRPLEMSNLLTRIHKCKILCVKKFIQNFSICEGSRGVKGEKVT